MKSFRCKLNLPRFVVLTIALLVSLATGTTVPAQSPLSATDLTAPSAEQAPLIVAGLSQNASASLAALPEADSLIYISPQRIMNDVLPRALTAQQLTEFRSEVADVQKASGIDLSHVEYFVTAMRFHKPADDLSFSPPDFLVIFGGDFNTDALMNLARGALSTKLHDEVYNSKPISVLNLSDMVGSNPFSKSIAELAITALDSNTIVAGTASYVRAAIDARQGKERISSQTIELLMRDPQSLVSVAGRPLASVARSLGLNGTETHPRNSTCDTRLGDFYAGVTLEGESFKLHGAMNADNPDTAKIIRNLLTSLLSEAKGMIPDQQARTALSGLTLTPVDNEVRVQAEIPLKVVLDYINSKTAKKAEATVAPSAKKPPVHRRRRTVKKKTT